MKETGLSIATWADETFGKSMSNKSAHLRATGEMLELDELVRNGVGGYQLAEECADIVIVLARLAYDNGQDLFEMVDRKMEINRARRWERDGTGHGYHVKDPLP